MNILELIIISIALAMDCFTVSMVSGVILKKHVWKIIIQMSFLFGLFQALMPLLGWVATSSFSEYVQDFDHWIAFGLLAFIGGRMIYESFLPREESIFDPGKLKTQVTLAIATSIDAFAVGISFACMGYDSLSSLTLPLVIIFFGSLLFSVAGNILGIAFGNVIANRIKPEIFGGIILILIGIKILVSHLYGL